MNIAIIVGISQYIEYPKEHGIIAAQKDAYRIKQLIEATNKFDKNILYITENTSARDVKNEIRSFIQTYETPETEIEEIFYYFSGHGISHDQEFYMLCSDYEKRKLNITSISNSEIDVFIRQLTPKLTVKVIDACYSGYRYLKDDSFSPPDYTYSKNRLENVIVMASSHDNQKSQMMEDTSYFTEKFIEGALSTNIGGKVLYRDIQAFIADEFMSMATQRPFFTNQATGTEVFSEYTEKMQVLKEQFYPKEIRETEAENSLQQERDGIIGEEELLNDGFLLDKIDNILTEKDALFVEEAIIKETLEDIKENISNYLHDEQSNDKIVYSFYQINLNWNKTIREFSKSPDLLKMANIEKWQDEYLIRLETKTETERVPRSDLERQLFGHYFGATREVPIQKPYSLSTLHSLPYETVWIEFQPKNKLSLSPFFAIIALVHSETHTLTLFERGIMIKDGWRHFTVDWDSLSWNKQTFLWRDIINQPTLLWKNFIDDTIQYIRKYLITIARN